MLFRQVYEVWELLIFFSKQGLNAEEKMDPHEKEKCDAVEWIQVRYFEKNAHKNFLKENYMSPLYFTPFLYKISISAIWYSFNPIINKIICWKKKIKIIMLISLFCNF